MKEVKLVNLVWDTGQVNSVWAAAKERNERREVEQYLAGLLNEGWQIAGTGGVNLESAFVILVRER